MTPPPKPNTIDEAALRELERLEKAATPGPWRNYLSILAAGETDPIFWPSMGCDAVGKDADVDLIAAARNALPALLDTIASLRQQLADAERRVASECAELCSQRARLRVGHPQGHEASECGAAIRARFEKGPGQDGE